MSWTSEPMNALINGGMKETRVKCAFLEHIEVEDFDRFAEYGYRGDSTVP